MSITRRDFLASMAVYSAMGLAPKFLTQAAADPIQAIRGFKDDRVLVVVQLGGGNDGLNTVVPHGHDTYYRLRPRLGLKGDQVLRIDDMHGLNAKMSGLMDLYGNGQAAIIQGVGYPNPDRSHFRSMEIWHTGSDSEEYLAHGWIGRYFDNTCSGTARPQAGMAVNEELPQAFHGARGFGVATDNPEKFGWNPGGPGATEAAFASLNPASPSGNDTLDFLRHTTSNALLSSKEVQAAAAKGKVEGVVQRGRRAGLKQLEAVAGLIRGGLDTRIFYVSTGGFDTHANQLGQHENLLGAVSQALAEFQATLERDGTAERVVTMVFSEFGRRAGENGSGGTDHGTAAPMFLLGKRIAPGLHGTMPDLDNLDQGDLRYTTDFRAVYAAVLEDWLGADAGAILGAQYAKPPIIV